MKAQLKVTNKLVIEVEAGDQKELFKELARLQEVFGEEQCGKCECGDTRFVVRTVDENDFYEMQCRVCYAKLAFGVHKKGGTLFPKRRDDQGKFIGQNGWGKWNPTTQTLE